MRNFISKLPITLSTPTVRQSPTQALGSVTSKTGLGVFASSDRLFKGAVFGRDSLEVAEDLMNIKPKLVERIILTLASLQGEVDNKDNEEEPGKIIHEYRTPNIDGRPLNEASKLIYDQLAVKWGGSDKELAYYGSVDSTPHFIKVLAKYCNTYGTNILSQQVKMRSGRTESVLSIMDSSIDWIVQHLAKSKSGFIEYHRKNPHGLINQVWKDSREFYVHENGQLASHSHPISSVEVQGLVYDAFTMASEIMPSKKFLNAQAKKIQENTFNLLWNSDRHYFALGTDYDKKMNLRVIKTMTANPAELLDSLIFDNLPVTEKQKYITGLVREIMGTDFLTDAGIRSRALSEAKVVEFWDYHGSYVTWPKETYDIAKGMRRQGFTKLARELENRLLNVVKATKSYPEFLYIDPRGRVLGAPTPSKTHGEFVMVDGYDQPERIQAWTVSAILAINSQRQFRSSRHNQQAPWQKDLEIEVLSHIPHVKRLRSSKELAARYPFYPYKLSSKK